MTKPDWIRDDCPRCNGEEWILSPGEAVEVRCPDCLRGYSIDTARAQRVEGRETDFSKSKSAKQDPEFQRIAERDRQRELQLQQELENDLDRYLAHNERVKRQQQQQMEEQLGKLD